MSAHRWDRPCPRGGVGCDPGACLACYEATRGPHVIEHDLGGVRCGGPGVCLACNEASTPESALDALLQRVLVDVPSAREVAAAAVELRCLRGELRDALRGPAR